MFISFSSLNSFLTCPRRWKWLQTEPLELTPPLRIGDLVHRTLRRAVEEDLDILEALPLCVEDETPSEIAASRNILRKFDLPLGKVIALEQKFEFDLGKHTVVGVVDRVEEIDGKTVITDYKTGKQVNDDYHLQAAIYTMAYPGSLFRFYYITLGKIITHNFTPQELDQQAKLIEAIADYMETCEEFEPAPNKYCRTCQFLSRCADGQRNSTGSFPPLRRRT